MKIVSILVAAGIASTAMGQLEWYNGDPDLVNGLAAEFNTAVADAYVFEDFDHVGGTISDIFGNYFISTNVQGYMYEIRSGVSNGFGGTLHANGNTDGAFSVNTNGWDAFGFTGYTMAADIADVSLAAGTYMMALSPIGDGQGRSFVQTTVGTNGVGSPTGNDLNWFHSNQFGANYAEGQQPGSDFSYGVNVPAPASAALLGLGGLVAIRRRR
jgi:hypothetical protein